MYEYFYLMKIVPVVRISVKFSKAEYKSESVAKIYKKQQIIN